MGTAPALNRMVPAALRLAVIVLLWVSPIAVRTPVVVLKLLVIAISSIPSRVAEASGRRAGYVTALVGRVVHGLRHLHLALAAWGVGSPGLHFGSYCSAVRSTGTKLWRTDAL